MAEWILTSSLLIVIVLAVRALFRGRMGLRLRYALWLLVLLRLLVPGTVFQTGLSVLNYVPLPQTAAAQAQPSQSGGSPSAPEAEPMPVRPEGEAEPRPSGPAAAPDSAPAGAADWRGVLTAVWLGGAGVLAAALLACNLRFYLRLRRMRRAHPIPGIAVPVYVARGLPSPCLYGFPRPAVYLTPAAAGEPELLGHVLRHELTHRRHGDHIWAVLRAAALALHWYNPLVWLAAVLSRRDGELACDEGALQGADDRERAAYGRTLIRLVTARPSAGELLCCATTMTAGTSSLKERIAMIARKPRTLAAVLAAVALLAGLAVGCTFTGGRSDAWEPLSEEELAYFNGDGFFNGGYLNIRNQFLSSTYAAPEEIDLFQLFYCGDGDADDAAPPDGVDPVALEAAMLAAEGGDDPDCPATILTTAQMDKVLEEYLGLTLAETGQVGLEHFTYLPDFDVYFCYHGDTNYRGSVTFTGGERRGELVRLTYHDTFLGDGYKQVTLRERGEGWQFVSNLAVQAEERLPLESGLAALPAELVDKVVVVEKNDLKSYNSGVLATYYYAPDYNTEWGGQLLQVGRYSQVGFEQSYYSWELTGGWSYLGRSGDWYYACHSPTDVNFNLDHYDDYHATGTALRAWLEELAGAAELTPMEEDTFYQRVTGSLSYPGGEHLRVSYRPYYGLSGYGEKAENTVYTLVLSQPAAQGEGGIWCVDRWVDQNGTRYLVVPEADQPMDDYYAALQIACDAGDRPDLREPAAVALAFEEAWSGRDLSLEAFQVEGPCGLDELWNLPLAVAEVGP
ncbi:MAG: M56 family metallopeptidase [Flavonifractor plautii]|uniref:M56 family metallopeptidase n=1 Tax=Flavonifractor plautii TaxID=292800 RepID=UPI0011DDAFA4|nr:M56 family metallopeptidase [Flavonifractor plautii]